MKMIAAPANGRPITRLKLPSPRRARVEIAAQLTESDLLAIVRLPKPAVQQPSLMLLPSRNEPDSGTVRALTYRAVDSQEVVDHLAGIRDFAREGLAWLDPKTRQAVLEFVVATTAAERPGRRRPGPLFAVDRDERLSASLHELRQALRERLPVSISHDGPMALVDSIARVDHDAFFMRGRLRLGASRLARVTAVSPEGSRVDILGRAYWYELPSDQPGKSAWRGFSVFYTCAPSLRASGWLVELETQSGELLEVGAPHVIVHPADVTRTILEDLAVEALPAVRLRTTQVLPAVRRLQRARRRAAKLDVVKQLGTPPRSPAVSVIVPLYRRIDLVEHQLTQFADDPAMRSAELIYVLDSPELKDELLRTAGMLFELYRQPFRVAVISANVGYAGANNLGASIARGRLLLLLNSDVFPETPGWLDAMVRFYDSLPNAGAIGPKLIYEDGTLQHAGMFFERLADNQPWNNEHFFKGMHRDLPAAARSRPVPSITGACLMVAANLYRKVGGLSGDYLQGDFEDSEFCLRLLETGRKNWYFADVALYHLEAASYDADRRRTVDAFNRWLHSHLWGERLSALDDRRSTRIAVNGEARLRAVGGARSGP